MLNRPELPFNIFSDWATEFEARAQPYVRRTTQQKLQQTHHKFASDSSMSTPTMEVNVSPKVEEPNGVVVNVNEPADFKISTAAVESSIEISITQKESNPIAGDKAVYTGEESGIAMQPVESEEEKCEHGEQITLQCKECKKQHYEAKQATINEDRAVILVSSICCILIGGAIMLWCAP